MVILEDGPLAFWRSWGVLGALKSYPKVHMKNRCPKRRPWGAHRSSQGAPRELQKAKWEPKGSPKGSEMEPKSGKKLV